MKKLLDKTRSWPFQEARILEENLKKNNLTSGLTKNNPVLFETGYGPSGLPHIGTFGEVARTAMVKHAFETLTGKYTKLICFSDDMDGLRKVPDNVPNQEILLKNINKPLSEVPDPFEKFDSFAEHNNSRLIEFLKKFNFDFEFISATNCYKSGRFNNALKKTLINYEKINNLVLPTLGIDRRATYSPFLPICNLTGQVLQVKIIETNTKNFTISYESPLDNKVVTTSILNGSCKLQWKCDWAMRWYALNVDYEMSGKDLSESVNLSSKIVKILGGNPPSGFSYELFLDKNGEKISKSRGNGLSIEEWLRYGTNESLSLFMYNNPKRAKKLFFDIIPKTIDEYFSYTKKLSDDIENKFDNPLWHIHKNKNPNIYFPLSFNLLLNLASVCHANDEKTLWSYISNYSPDLKQGLNTKFDELVTLSLNYYRERILPFKKYRGPTDLEKKGIINLIEKLNNVSDKVTSEDLQSIVFSVGKELRYENLRDWFSGLYETVLGQSNGPRLGGFIKLYGIKNTIILLKNVLNKTLLTEK